MISPTPGTDTPRIYANDLPVLEWAAKFCATGPEASTPEELLGLENAGAVQAGHRYAALTGKASNNTWELLLIIERLAEQARQDAATIARQHAELMAVAQEASDLRGQLRVLDAINGTTG